MFALWTNYANNAEQFTIRLLLDSITIRLLLDKKWENFLKSDI